MDTFRIFIQVLFLLALFAFYCVSVMGLNESDTQNFECNWKNFTCENAWWLINATDFRHGAFI